MQSYGLYTVVLHEEFSWSMTVLSGAFALTRVESGLLGPLQGWLVDRYGPRIILTVGLAMFGIGFLGLRFHQFRYFGIRPLESFLT